MASSGPSADGRPRGRGRGNRGKALRARGRHGLRPADWRPHAGGDEVVEEVDEEAQAEWEAKWRHRALGSNEDRYRKPEPEDGEGEEEEPEEEVDLSAFVAKQREAELGAALEKEEDEDVDHSLDHVPTTSRSAGGREKPKPAIGVVQWDPELEEMLREKQKAEAIRDLKARFKGNTPSSQTARRGVQPQPAGKGAALPSESAGALHEDESFLDDLLR